MMSHRRLVPRTLLLALAAAIALPGSAAAQAADPDIAKRQGDRPTPAGWTTRLDRANADKSTLTFAMEGARAMRITTGPSAIFWDAKNASQGPFALGATFHQLRKPAHPEAYGLIWGGTDLESDRQAYYYLIVRGDGKYMVKHRAGAETHELVPWTEHAALVKEDAEGKATNALRVQATAAGVRLFANGQLLRELPADATGDGVAGIRVNHNLDVTVEGFGLRKP
jgi:hypothetical protein